MQDRLRQSLCKNADWIHVRYGDLALGLRVKNHAVLRGILVIDLFATY